MATEKRLIDANAYVDELKWLQTQVSSASAIEIQEYINRTNRQPTVDAVEVSRLGRLGKLMMPYIGCPRGRIGTRFGIVDNDITRLDAITDVDGNRWVPVLEDELNRDICEVVRCKDCKYFKDWGDGTKTCDYWTDQWDCATDSDAYCSYGERKDNG